LEKDTLTYCTFEELFPREKNSLQIIKQELSSFWLNDLMQVLAKLNYLVSFSQYRKTDPEEIKFMSHFLSKETMGLFLSKYPHRKLVTRQQMLATIKLAFLYASSDDRSLRVLNNEEKIGKILFRSTDFLENYEPAENRTQLSPKERQNLYATFARNLLFNEGYTFVTSLVRYWHIFNKTSLIKRNKSVGWRTLFKKITGVRFNYFIAIGFTIWAFYQEKNKFQRITQPHEFLMSDRYFKHTSSYKTKNLSQALNLICGDYDFYKQFFQKENSKDWGPFFFWPLWEKPLLKNEFGSYFLLDFNYLERKFFAGIFWLMFDSFDNSQEKHLLKSNWGYLFEDYVFQIANKSYPPKPKRTYREITGLVDLVIYYPDTIFFIEITTKNVPHNYWMQASYQEIKKSLERILIKEGKSKGKVVQLLEAIEKLKSGEVVLEGVDISKIKRFIPIILFENAPPRHRMLWHIYEAILKEHGISKHEFLTNIEFWDIEEFEMVMADVAEGRSLLEIMKDKSNFQSPKDTIRNYYMFHRGGRSKHPLIEESFEIMTDGFSKTLFRKQALGNTQTN